MADSVHVLSRSAVSWHCAFTDVTEEEIMRRYLAVDLG
jgi:hypothetical protein